MAGLPVSVGSMLDGDRPGVSPHVPVLPQESSYMSLRLSFIVCKAGALMGTTSVESRV